MISSVWIRRITSPTANGSRNDARRVSLKPASEVNMFDDLDGKVALVTGAGSGLGKAAALSLARAGANLILKSRSQDEIEAVADKARAMGVKAFAQVADVSDSASVEGLFAAARKHFGQLDIVLANAGVNGLWAPIEELPIE